jgi:hypothetical protein
MKMLFPLAKHNSILECFSNKKRNTKLTTTLITNTPCKNIKRMIAPGLGGT